MKLSCGLLAVVAATCLATSANAMLVLTETFTYPDGDLVGNGGWQAHSGAGSTPVQVSGGAISLTHGSGSREDVSLDIGVGPIVQGTLTFNFDVTVSASSSISGTDFEYFAHFSDGGTSTFIGRLDIVSPTGTGDFGFGIAQSSSTAESTTTTDFDFDTTIPVSVTYSFDDAQASLTVGSETIVSAVGTNPGLLSHVAFRQSNSSSDETIVVDNLAVLYTVPEPSAFLFGTLICGVLGAKYSRKRDRS